MSIFVMELPTAYSKSPPKCLAEFRPDGDGLSAEFFDEDFAHDVATGSISYMEEDDRPVHPEEGGLFLTCLKRAFASSISVSVVEANTVEEAIAALSGRA